MRYKHKVQVNQPKNHRKKIKNDTIVLLEGKGNDTLAPM